MAQAKTRVPATHAAFVAETYTPPELHMFISSGSMHHVPQRDDLDPEIVLRDPEVHLLMTWTQVLFQYIF